MTAARAARIALAACLLWAAGAACPAGAAQGERVLRVVGDENYPPFLFVDPQGNAAGYVHDWWKLWERKTGVRVEIDATNWARAQRTILRGDADVIDNIFRTPAREALYDFTAPYASVPVAIYAHRTLPGVRDLAGLRGFVVGVMDGDACVEKLKSGGVTTLRLYPNYSALIGGAVAEEIRLFCLDEYPADYYLYRNNAQRDFRKAFKLYEGQFARAVRKGDLETLRLVERGAAAITPEEDAALRAKWIRPGAEDFAPYVFHLAAGLGALAAVALLLVAWIAATRAAVRRRTAELEAAQARLAERVKERACLFEVTRATEKRDVTVQQLFEELVVVVPQGLRRPQAAAARIEWGDCAAQGPAFREGPARKIAQFTTADGRIGRVTIAYVDGAAPAGTEAFEPEERALVDEVAARVAGSLDRRATEASLREREEIYRTIVDQAVDSILLFDVEDWRVVEFNAATHLGLGYSREEFARLALADYDEHRSEQFVREQVELMARPEGHTFETRMRHRDGSLRDVRVSGRGIEIGGRRYVAMIRSDITAHKRASETLQRMNRALRATNECDQAIARAPDEGWMLREVCERIVGVGGYRLAWIGFPEHDAARTVRVVAHAGGSEGYLDTIRVSWADDPHGHGPTGTAIRERRSVVVRDFASDPKVVPWRAQAARMGLASSAAVPLVLAGDAFFGALMVYSDTPHSFDEEELQLLEKLARSLAFGIQAQRNRVERERAEEATRAMTTRLAHLLEASPVIVYTLEYQGDALAPSDVSANVERLLGYTVAEALAPGWWRDGLHPDDRDTVLANTPNVLRDGRLLREFRFRDRAGHYVWIHDECRVTRVEGGKPVEVVGAWTDVSVLRESNELIRKLSLAVEQSPVSVMITDLEGYIQYVNDAFLKSSGYEPEDVLGHSPSMLQSGKTPPETYRALWATLAAGRPWQGEFINRRKDGRECIERTNILPLRQPDGRVTHYVSLAEDVTERRQLDLELESYRKHLEDVVEARTAELADARLRAESASRAKSLFLANMSHEIRTPMNAIIGLTYLLRNSPLAPEQSARLSKIETSAHHLLALINDILDLSKIESGKLGIERASFRPNDVIDDALETVRAGAADKGLALDADVDAALPEVAVGDALRLRQVLLNLLSNAIKFTARGSVRLRVRVIADGATHADVRFEVRDTGAGIPPEQRAKLFQPFVQGDESATRKYGGTGLGLAISRSLVELMGGRIGLESETGKGSTFWFTVPLARASGAERASGRLGEPSEKRERAAGAGPRAGASMRILIVEDDALNREVARELLAGAGHSVSIAVNGAEALDVARGSPPFDVVLMDMQMPVMNGLEATRELRTLAGYAQVPILALSGEAFEEDRARCLEAGMNDFLVKPVAPERLFEAIEHWAGAAATAGTPPSRRAAATLESIPGLDLAAGLKMVQGNRSLYERLMRIYSTDHATAAARIRDAIAAGDRDTALAIAHNLKGTAATLGANVVAAAATALNASLRGGADDAVLAPIVTRLDLAQTALLEGLAAALSGGSDEVPAASRAEAIAVVRQLEALLAADDMQAVTLFHEHEASIGPSLGARAAEISSHISAFEFDAALPPLREALRELEQAQAAAGP